MTLKSELYLWPWEKLNSTAFSTLVAKLPQEDWARADAIKVEEKKWQFLLSRLLLRTLFKQKIGGDLSTTLKFSEKGKPYVDGGPFFNLSHTHKFSTLIISTLGEVGVDVEWSNPRKNISGVAENYANSKEREQFAALKPEQVKDQFYKYWCLKESYAKATGKGLSGELTQLFFAEEGTVEGLSEDCIFHFLKYDSHYVATCCRNVLNADLEVFLVNANEHDLCIEKVHLDIFPYVAVRGFYRNPL